MKASLRIHAHLLATCAILSIGIAGCGKSKINGGAVDGSTGPDASAAQLAAQQAFANEVLGLFTSNNCTACHAQDNEIGFIFPDPDEYTRIKSWPDILDFETPSNSLLLTKGQHAGPAWNPEDFEAVKNWIELEALALGIDNTDNFPVTPLFTPSLGFNAIDLSAMGLPGSRITFLMEALDTGAYLSEIRLEAGTGGAHIVHPLFLLYVDGTLQPDPVDRFSFVDMSLDEGVSEYIGGGTFVIVNFPQGSDMMIQFALAEPLAGPGMDGGVLLSCLDVDAFTTNAQPVLTYCAQHCHAGGNAQATSATDMIRMLDPSPEGQAIACGQIISRINLLDPPNSGLFLAPDLASGTQHLYKFGDPNPPVEVQGLPANPVTFQQFKDAVLIWANSEATLQAP